MGAPARAALAAAATAEPGADGVDEAAGAAGRRGRLLRWVGVVVLVLFALLFAFRTAIEERALVADLPGYADYAARVRYRLFPGLW